MSHLFVYMMATDAGWNAFRNQNFNDAPAGVLQYWYRFLSNEISCQDSRTVLNDRPTGRLSPPAYEESRLFQFEVGLDK